MKLYLLLLLLLNITTLYADPPIAIWNKTFGGTNIDVGHSVIITSDGSYVITGYTRSFGTVSGRNFWLVKTDPSGNLIWSKGYGGNSDEEAYDVIEVSSGGYLMVGYTSSFGAGVKDFYLIKTDTAGNQLWQKTYGGANDDEAFSLKETPDGGFIIAGVTSSFAVGGRDVWLIKTDSAGNEQWRKNLGGLSSDGARSIELTPDGGFIFTGWTFSHGPGSLGNLWLVKTDSLGNQLWHKFFGGTGVDRGYSVKVTSDSGFIVTGYTSSFGNGLDDMLIIRTDPEGNEIWNKSFGGSGRDYGNSIIQTSDGGFLSAGYTLSFGAGGDDFFLVKTYPNGDLEWTKTFGGTSSDVAYSIVETNDGGAIIAGHTLSSGAGVHDLWLIRTSSVIPVELTSFTAETSAGQIVLSWSTSSELNNKGFEIERKSPNSGWAFIGFIPGNGTSTHLSYYQYTDTPSNRGTFTYRLKQIDFDGTTTFSPEIEVSLLPPAEIVLYNNYPNPFNPATTISFSLPVTTHIMVKIYSVTGDEILTLVEGISEAGFHSLTFDASELPSGFYLCTLTGNNIRLTQKLLLLK